MDRPVVNAPSDRKETTKPPIAAIPLVRLDLALIVALLLLAIGARALPGPRTIDDAYITFRYSRNIVNGLGFVYNPDSRVLGTTTPLFTVILAAISAITRGADFPSYAIIVSALADAGTVALLFLLVRRVTGSRWVGVLLGVLWAIAPRSVTFAVGGMETSLTIFWMIGAVWFYVIDRPIWLGIFAALGVLTRIDVGLLVGLLFAYQLYERFRRREAPPWRTWLAALIVAAPWLIFSLIYFGSPLSRTTTAKTVAYAVPPGSALITLIQTYSTPFFEFDTFGSVGAEIGAIAYVLLAAIGSLYAVKRAPRLLPWLLYPWLYAAAFAIANPLIFRWYATPPMPPYFFAIVCGGWALIDGLASVRGRWKTSGIVGKRGLLRAVPLAALSILWIGTSLHAWTLHPDHGTDQPAPTMAWYKIERDYQKIAGELRSKYGITAQTIVASADIGVIGYFSGATIVDTVGLVTPALSSYYPADRSIIIPGGNYAIPPALILDTKPEYFVTMEAFVRLGLAKDRSFQAEYELIDEIPTDFYGTGMLLYSRRKSF